MPHHLQPVDQPVDQPVMRWLRSLACLIAASVLHLTLAGSALAQRQPTAVLEIDFDGLAHQVLPAGVSIQTQFSAPDVVPGVSGTAWRTDGFSSYLASHLQLDARRGFTLSLWVALESYPADREVPVAELSPSSIAQQWLGDAGFDITIDAFGRWSLKVATADGLLRVAAPQRFPLRQWVHIVATADPASGTVTLRQDGKLIGTATGKAGTSLRLAPTPFKLAVPPVEATILDFKINRINGAYDLVAVYPQALTDEQITLLSGPSAGPSAGRPTGQTPDANASLQVPATRFAADALRPRVHPMPPANWTNEPHGLTKVGDAWHLFYQRTPNGPYKTLMHWGHMTSRDLVRWEHLPDALWPELQTDTFGFDMKGIWSGHVITDGGKAFAFYTSVNHGDRIAASNPGIAMAVSEDAQLRDWRKVGPVVNSQGVKDFRDPYLWKDGNTWHMIVGAALESGGGLQYYVLQTSEQGARWKPKPRFTEPGFRVLDPGSELWEMPVFERLSGTVWLLLANPIGGRFSKYGDTATRAVYWTGEWTGSTFKPFAREPKNLDLVPGHLAPTVARADDGRLRAIGIIDERRTPAAQHRAGWAHTFSLPRVWALLPDQRTLGQAPAPELLALRGEARMAGTTMNLSSVPTPLSSTPGAYELQIKLNAASPSAGPVVIEVLASADGREFTQLIFDAAKSSVSVDLTHSTLSGEREGPPLLLGRYDTQAFGDMHTLRVFVDGSAIDVFVNDAAAYGVRSYPSLAGSTGLRISQSGKPALAADVSLWPLRLPASH